MPVFVAVPSSTPLRRKGRGAEKCHAGRFFRRHILGQDLNVGVWAMTRVASRGGFGDFLAVNPWVRVNERVREFPAKPRAHRRNGAFLSDW
jgi:hypothetical protein